MKSSILILSRHCGFRHRNTLQPMSNWNDFNLLAQRGIDITRRLIADKESASSNAKKMRT